MALYCDSKCQRADWRPWHAPECASWAELRNSADTGGLGLSFESSAARGRHAVLRVSGPDATRTRVEPGTILWTERPIVAVPLLHAPTSETSARAYGRETSGLDSGMLAACENANRECEWHVCADTVSEHGRELNARMRNTDWCSPPYTTSSELNVMTQLLSCLPRARTLVLVDIMQNNMFSCMPLTAPACPWYNAFYRLASYINTSCVANAAYSFHGAVLVIRATQRIKDGDEVCIAYELPAGITCNCVHCAGAGKPNLLRDDNADVQRLVLAGMQHVKRYCEPRAVRSMWQLTRPVDDMPLAANIQAACENMYALHKLYLRHSGAEAVNFAIKFVAMQCTIFIDFAHAILRGSPENAQMLALRPYARFLSPLLVCAGECRYADPADQPLGGRMKSIVIVLLASLALAGMRTGEARGTDYAPERVLLACNAIAGAGAHVPPELEIVLDAPALGPRLYAEHARRYAAGLNAGTPVTRYAAGWDELARIGAALPAWSELAASEPAGEPAGKPAGDPESSDDDSGQNRAMLEPVESLMDSLRL